MGWYSLRQASWEKYGTVKGEEYFQCDKNYGIFVRMKTLTEYDPETHAVNKIQTLARGVQARKRTREKGT